MSARVRFRLHTGAEHEVPEGGILGRSRGAALQLEAADISEAHALVSRRASSLRLLALRGRVSVDGVPTRDVELRPGLLLGLGADVRIEVVAVEVDGEDGGEVVATLGGDSPGLDILVREGVVRIRQGGGPTLTLTGNLGEVMRLLLVEGRPTHWTTLARYFWPERDQASWRQRFDATLKELRGKLRESGVRDDLLRSNQGEWWLDLADGDLVRGLDAEPAGGDL